MPKPAAAQSATLSADAAVNSAHNSTNYGTLSNLYVSSTSTALLRFDLGMLPSGTTASQVSRATLRVYVNRVNTPGVIAVSAVQAAWAETAVTLQTLPPIGNAAEVFPVTDEGQFVTVDVTSLVQAWLTTPSGNFGLALTASSADAVFDSKENDTTAHPADLQIALTSGTVGPTGPQGPAGPKGNTGATGPQGATGETGPQGPKGDPGTGGGLAYRGAWASSTMYAVNDVVTSGGAAWVSLLPGNVGNAPSSSSAAWGVLVPAATAGGGGTATAGNGLMFAGAYAPGTNYSTNQVVTWQSAAWVSLIDSNHGNAPDQSPLDWALLVPASNNPASITTVINGLLFDGAYNPGTNYATNHVVTWQNTAWVGLHDSNHGNAPDISPNDWAALVPAAIGVQGPAGATGATGPQGPQGERGYTGDTGPQGPRGATGATGRPGFVYQGNYASIANYAAGDVVLWQGGSWASLHDSNNGNTPDSSPADWGPLTTRGLTGETGATGATGPQGPQGLPGTQGMVGPQGPTGPVGSTGPQGAPGRDGAQGPLGDTGPAGPQGPAGPVGLTWQGSYQSSTNYATNDAVAWQGQTWLSLHNTNYGNTPDTSLADWTLLAARGAVGPTGPQGAQGPQGLTGNAGPEGLKGDTGDTGPAGATGAAGMQFIGPYDSTTSYNLHDAVSFGGGTWISLTASNHGNTPGTQPLQWAQVAAPGGTGPAGPQGPQGGAGPTGSTGPQGPAGPQGAQGQPVHFTGPWSALKPYVVGDAVFYNGSAYIAISTVTGNPPGVSPSWSLLAQQGDTGAAGPQGPQGPTGNAGVAGSTGPQGPAGAPGLRWKGTYDPASGYSSGDAVAYNGASYISPSDGNVGNTPGTNGQWTLLASAGAAGLPGPQGAAGTNGANGTAATIQVGTVNTLAAGSPATVQNVGSANAAVLNFSLPAGAAGAAGTPGLVYRGTWMQDTGYSNNDAVFRNGSSYISRHDNNITDPSVSVANNTGDWSLLASQGDAGPATVQIGTVSSGASAAVTNSGTQNAAVLNFTLPRGATGATGPVGLTFRGAWDASTSYQSNDAVSYAGSSYLAKSASSAVAPTGVSGSAAAWALLAAQGSTGADGATGPAGVTPTIAVHATHTGAPGSSATVTNVGSSTNVLLDFTIPQGANGAAGASGSSGSGGGAVYTTVHTVVGSSGGLQVYSPLVDGHAAGDVYGIVAYLPSTCNLGSVLVYNSASADAHFEIHTGTPGSMTVTSAGTCTAKANSAITCTGPGTLGTSNFVSFGIFSGSSTTSYIYTQFTCN